MGSPSGRKRFFSFGKKINTDDWMMEKVNIENKIRSTQKELDGLKKTGLPKDIKERMNILIDIGKMEDDLMSFGRELIKINKKILKQQSKKQRKKNKASMSEDISIYQSVISSDSSPIATLSNEKGLDVIHTQTMEEICVKLKEGLEIKDRSYIFNTYHQCFIGKSMVSFMLKNNICKSREEGESIGKLLISAGMIQHVLNQHDFKDDKLFYRFVDAVLSPKSV